MFFCAFFPQLRETLWKIFGFLRIFPQKNAFYPKNPLITPFFSESGCGKFCSNFPQSCGFFHQNRFFPHKAEQNSPQLRETLWEKSKGRRYGAGDRRVAPALCGRKSGLFRKPSRRLDPSFVSRCVSKSYVNITKVMRNRISTTEIRISRERPPQARPSEFVFHGNAHCKARPPKFVFRGNARRKARPSESVFTANARRKARPSEFVFHGNARRRRDYRNSYFAATAAPQGVTIGIRFHGKRSPQGAQGRRAQKRQAFTACLFLFFRNALILREARAYLRDRTDTLPDSKHRRRHRCSTCCRPWN